LSELPRWTVGFDHIHYGCPEALLFDPGAEEIATWTAWKRFGSPLDGGWTEWPARLVDLLSALDAEDARLTAEKLKHPEE
jgi:hypothetical protein